jgi:SulP family sulfate permease
MGDRPVPSRPHPPVSPLERYLPILRWLPAYPREWLRGDLTAGITSWGVMVPVALAYAGLAGVPPELGLVTAFAALAAYAVFGTSRFSKVTVSSTMAVMSASVIGSLGLRDPATAIALTAALALIVGGMLVGAGIARLGFISDFLSKAVVTGFIAGLAITIIVGQLPKVLGVSIDAEAVPEQVLDLAAEFGGYNPYAIAIGLISIAIILGLRAISRKIPGPLVALVLGIVAVPVLGLEDYGVAVVGEIATGLPLPSLPRIPLSDVPFLIVGAAGIVFLAVGESIGTARAYAAKHGDRIDVDQELLALGASNLASGMFGGFVADASVSQSATAEDAGARSQLSSLVTAGLVLLTVLLLAPLFKTLPNAVLGAIVIVAALSLIDIGELRRYWAWRRADFAIALVALVGVVLTSVLVGMVVAVLLSLVLLLYRASRPYVAALGRLSGGRGSFADLARHAEAVPIPGILVARIDAPLYFFNANVAYTQIIELFGRISPAPSVVVLDLAATADLDVSTGDMLFELHQELRALGVELRLAQVRAKVRDRMRTMGLMDEIGEQRVHLSVAAAVEDQPDRPRVAGTVSPD